jgi:hypothetical protein
MLGALASRDTESEPPDCTGGVALAYYFTL